MKRYVLITLVALVGLSVFALPDSAGYLSFLSDRERQELAAAGEITRFGSAPGDLPLWQRAPFSDAVRSALGGTRSTLASEGLFLVDLPPARVQDDLSLRMVRAFTAFSTMKGLQVYSASLGKMETFIYDSCRIGSLEKKDPLPDPVFGSAPGHAEFLIYQKEEQTGAVYSAMSFDARDGYCMVRLNNLTALRYLFFTLVAPRDLTTLFIMVPTSDKVVLYGVTVARTPQFLGIERTKQSSFFNRMKALASWFSANLARGQ